MEWIKENDNQALVLGIVNGGVSLFEMLTGYTGGVISLATGASTLGYGVYRYVDVKKDAPKRNWGDEIGDFVGSSVDVVEGGVKGTAWAVENWQIVLGVAGVGVTLYLASFLVDIPQYQLSKEFVTPLIGGAMGGAGCLMLHLAEKVEEDKKKDPTLWHKVADTITHTVDDIVDAGGGGTRTGESMIIGGAAGVAINAGLNKLKKADVEAYGFLTGIGIGLGIVPKK